MIKNKLKINGSKTEFSLLTSSFLSNSLTIYMGDVYPHELLWGGGGTCLLPPHMLWVKVFKECVLT